MSDTEGKEETQGAPEEVLAAGGVSKNRRSAGPPAYHRRRKIKDASKDVKRSLSSPGRFKDSTSTSEMEDEDDDSRPLIKSPSMPPPSSDEEPPKPAVRRRVLKPPKQQEPRPKSEEPPVRTPHPAVKKEELAVKEEDPVVKKEEPVVKKEEPVEKKEEPVVKKEEPVVKEEEPVVRKEEPVVKKELPVVKKEEPAAKKNEPVYKHENTEVKAELAKKDEEEKQKGDENKPKQNETGEFRPPKEKESWWKYWPSWGRKRSKSVELEPSEVVQVPRRQSLTKESTPEPSLRKRHNFKDSKNEDLTLEDDTNDAFWKSEVSKASQKSSISDSKTLQSLSLSTCSEYKRKTSWREFLSDAKSEYRQFSLENPEKLESIRKLRNRCINEFIIIMIYCGLGAFMFKFTEGAFESFYKCGVKRVKRDFIDELWKGSHYLTEDEWKSKARRKLMEFENQLQEAFEAGMTSYSGQKSWSFLNAVIYCITVITTIGYGHIAPSTTTGRALTIVYAVIGIPLFLILLADFGKLFTRVIKWIWAFVRRVYYTGSCKKVRKTVPVQGVMKGVQVMYDMATFNRGNNDPNQHPQEVVIEGSETPHSPTSGEPPSTPAPSVFAIDDEFNLPISVAIVILIIYIMCGATLFYFWESDWTFFESFYFVFISMSTIGFGDMVPQNKMYMMASIVYLAFGLALTTMCINVVQEKLSDTFRQATAKIGATIGLTVSNEDGAVTPATPANVELAQIHKSSSNHS